jgi:hypothetical protein
VRASELEASALGADEEACGDAGDAGAEKDGSCAGELEPASRCSKNFAHRARDAVDAASLTLSL